MAKTAKRSTRAPAARQSTPARAAVRGATGAPQPANAGASTGTGGLAPQSNRREEKSAARRAAILAAALDEFSAAGFAAARLDDVAKRAGVAKGTIYLHFQDKEALFQELVRTTLGPLIAALEHLQSVDVPLRQALERFADMFVRDVFGTKRRNVIRLILTEGARFPTIAEFYYHEVVERGMLAMRRLIERAVARGEIRHQALARFPQLIAAPAMMAILWSSLFERFAPLDVAGLMHAHIELLFGRENE